MNKLSLSILFSFVWLCTCLPLLAGKDNRLYIYTWYDFIPAQTIEQFISETGIEVVVDFYETNHMLEAQLLTEKSGYDLVFPSAWPFLARQVAKNLYQPLDKRQLPNLKHLDPDIMRRLAKADPDNAHAVPYFWGITGIGYNKRIIQAVMPEAPVDTWAILLDPDIIKRFSEYGVCLLDEPFDIFYCE